MLAFVSGTPVNGRKSGTYPRGGNYSPPPKKFTYRSSDWWIFIIF